MAAALLGQPGDGNVLPLDFDDAPEYNDTTMVLNRPLSWKYMLVCSSVARVVHQIIRHDPRVPIWGESKMVIRKITDRRDWRVNDVVVVEVLTDHEDELFSKGMVELESGRMIHPMRGQLVICALAHRRSTQESVGSFLHVGDDLRVDLLTEGGACGAATDISTFMPDPMVKAVYRAHVAEPFLLEKDDDVPSYPPASNEKTLNLEGILDAKYDSIPPNLHHVGQLSSWATNHPQPSANSECAFPRKTVLIFGTSMSSGKTVAGTYLARAMRESVEHGNVFALKLTGAGQLHDIQRYGDCGATHVFDFVDAGLISTANIPPEQYMVAIARLLRRLCGSMKKQDACIIEIGSSPFEDYNGLYAAALIASVVKMSLVAASDAYALKGMVAVSAEYSRDHPEHEGARFFNNLFTSNDHKRPICVGPAANTRAGRDLVKNITGLEALNLALASHRETLANLLAEL